MSLESLNPIGLPQPTAFSQVVVATGSRMVFISGQVARTREGRRVAKGDLTAQARQAISNVGVALGAAGGSYDDVAKLTVFVVDPNLAKMEQVMRGISLGAAPSDTATWALTMVGVTSLAEPDLLVEIDTVAVLA